MKITHIFPLLFLLLFSLILSSSAQDHDHRYSTLDIQKYSFEIDLNDSSNIIRCEATIDISFKTELVEFFLDLTGIDQQGIGMVVEEILEDGDEVIYIHERDRINFSIPKTMVGEKRSYQIKYFGIPSDGLIISSNKFGDRTFFGDNWPNRAHHWLPTVDHPSDKALVEFRITAPGHYGIVSNGTNLELKHEAGRVFSHWKTAVPLPTKLMVIGVSPFAVQHMKSKSGIPVSSWVYPQNSSEGFYDYSIAIAPLDFFESYIAPYPYTKLANVQSKTVYGGMENASCIFYSERTVNGKQNRENLFAHEIAHQWFGDAVSEQNWHHVWLSEGFATYLTDLYIENQHGRDAFVASLLEEKRQVIEFAGRRLAPIIDTTLGVSVRLLNKNTYEKAGWVLHMLRKNLGDELFRMCVQTFYSEFKYGNALTKDFRSIVDSISGENYAAYFQQWFYRSGHPVLSCKMDYNAGQIELTITQHQDSPAFFFPLDVKLSDEQGHTHMATLPVDSREQTFYLDSHWEPDVLRLDPDHWLLFEPHESSSEDKTPRKRTSIQ